MKIILITGACGFVGSNIARILSGKYELWALDVEEKFCTLYKKFYSWEETNIIPYDQVHTIIHLAGKAHDVKNNQELNSYIKINTDLTKKIYNHFTESSAKKFIFFSSVKAVADFVPADYLTENTTPQPQTPYGISKLMAEDFILKNPAEEKSIYILRPCMIHGPGNKGNLNLLYHVVKKGIPWPLKKFENRRSFTSIDNLCFIIENLICKNIPTGIYNVADDEALSTNQIITIMGDVMDKKVSFWNVPVNFIKGVATLGDYLRFPLNSNRLTKLTENYVVSNKKLKHELGVQNMPMNAKEGFIKTIKSFQEA